MVEDKDIPEISEKLKHNRSDSDQETTSPKHDAFRMQQTVQGNRVQQMESDLGNTRDMDRMMEIMD